MTGTVSADTACRELDRNVVTAYLLGESDNYDVSGYTVDYPAPAIAAERVAEFGLRFVDGCAITASGIAGSNGASEELILAIASGQSPATMFADMPGVRLEPVGLGEESAIVWGTLAGGIEVPSMGYVKVGDKWLFIGVSGSRVLPLNLGEAPENTRGLSIAQAEERNRTRYARVGELLQKVMAEAVATAK